jgi:hypothetical protein
MTSSIGTKKEHRQADLQCLVEYGYYPLVSARHSKSAKPSKVSEWLVYRLGGAKQRISAW